MLNQNSLRTIEAQIAQNLRTTSLGQNLLVLTKKIVYLAKLPIVFKPLFHGLWNVQTEF